ncbi:hypothetical protein ACFQ6V_13040 [Streptomyces roseifaciens]
MQLALRDDHRGDALLDAPDGTVGAGPHPGAGGCGVGRVSIPNPALPLCLVWGVVVAP